MIADPWRDGRMDAIAPRDRILMIGTGLTMVDQILALAARGHQGETVALSRRGRLPAAHCPRRTDPVAVALPDGVPAIRTLFRQVVAAARRAAAAGEDWRAVIDGLRPATQDLWRGLDLAEKRRFCRHVECLWSVVRHRMAPEIAEQVAAARRNGRLDVRAGRVVAVRKGSRGLVAALQARGGRTVELAGFDWIVNCSGIGQLAVEAAEGPLAPLAALGLLRADPLRRGIDVTPAGEILGHDGAPTPGLYALGPLGAGALHEITAMPDIRVQAGLAAALIASAGPSRARFSPGSFPAVLRSG